MGHPNQAIYDEEVPGSREPPPKFYEILHSLQPARDLFAGPLRVQSYTVIPMGIDLFVTLSTLLATLISAAAASTAVIGLARAFIRRATGDVARASIDDREVEEAVAELRGKLIEGDGTDGKDAQQSGTAPTPGELEARAIIEVYGEDLIAEAQRIAKRARAERPSKDHVRQAADRIGILRDRAGVASDLALALGSILIGGAVAFQVNLWTGGEANDGIGLWVAVGLAIGVGIVVAAGAIKLRRT